VTDPVSLVAVLASVGVVLLLVERTRPPIADPPASGRGPVLVVAVVAGAAVLLTGSDRLVPTLVVAAAGGAGLSLWRRRRRRREAQLVAERVREACEHLSAELGVGLPSGDALDQVASSWHPLAPVAEAHRIGADVPDALRRAALQPGAGDLRLLAAAWQVAHRTGQGLAASVDRVAADLAAARRTRRVVEGELASARATARLVAGLPALAWAMGSGAGGDPVGFLLGTPLGWACLALGSAFGLAGLWWIEAIARDVDGPA
jgi:tight adherence protein B